MLSLLFWSGSLLAPNLLAGGRVLLALALLVAGLISPVELEHPAGRPT